MNFLEYFYKTGNSLLEATNKELIIPMRKISFQLLALSFLITANLNTGSTDPGPKATKTIPTILTEIKSGDEAVKEKAVFELKASSPHTRNDVKLLEQAAMLRDKNIREAALEALANVSPESTELKSAYLELLDNKSEKIQVAAFKGCAALKNKEAAPKILDLLSDRSRFTFIKGYFGGMGADDIDYSQQAAIALVELDYFEAIDELLSRDEIMAISSFGGPLLAKFGARALPKALTVARTDRSLRKDGAHGVIACMQDEAAIPDLIALLKDPDSEIILSAVSALARMPTTSEINKQFIEKALEEQLNNKNSYIRRKIYSGLLYHNPKKYLPLAMKALETDPFVRLSIFYALMQNPVPEAVPALKQFILKDEIENPNSTNQRAVAAQAIYKISGERVPYKGIEKDKQLYPDPYDPNNFNRR